MAPGQDSNQIARMMRLIAVSIAGLSAAVLLSAWFVSTPIVRSAASVETGRAPVGLSSGGIVSRAMPESRNDQIIRLADLAAEPYEALGSVRRLRFVGIDFTANASNDRMTSPADRKARDLVLDLSLPRELATILISAEPIAWAVNNRGVRERARIGFEGAAPFSIRAEPGALSGFRIGAFGADRTANPVDLVDQTRPAIARFCAAMMHWGNHFGVEIERMEYVLLTNPTSITIGAETTTSTGRTSAFYAGSTLRTLCYGPPRQGRFIQGRPIYNKVSRQWN